MLSVAYSFAAVLIEPAYGICLSGGAETALSPAPAFPIMGSGGGDPEAIVDHKLFGVFC